MLELGPLHFKVKAHIQRTIEDPDILLNQDAGYEFGSMDGKPWHTPEATKAVLKLSPSLPHLKPVLVAFFKGALTTWEHFTSEFEEGGLIHSTTAEERDRAWMPPTNDVNEVVMPWSSSELWFEPEPYRTGPKSSSRFGQLAGPDRWSSSRSRKYPNLVNQFGPVQTLPNLAAWRTSTALFGESH